MPSSIKVGEYTVKMFVSTIKKKPNNRRYLYFQKNRLSVNSAFMLRI